MRARKSDPVTSFEAAGSVRNVTATMRGILSILESKNLTDQELFLEYMSLAAYAKAPWASESGVRSRRSELVALGLVECVEFSKTRSGRRCSVWGLKRVA